MYFIIPIIPCVERVSQLSFISPTFSVFNLWILRELGLFYSRASSNDPSPLSVFVEVYITWRSKYRYGLLDPSMLLSGIPHIHLHAAMGNEVFGEITGGTESPCIRGILMHELWGWVFSSWTKVLE